MLCFCNFGKFSVFVIQFIINIFYRFISFFSKIFLLLISDFCSLQYSAHKWAMCKKKANSLPEMRCFSDSMILVTGLRWTEKVWKSCGPDPTVSGCCTMTRTVPELVPYAISIQFPLSPEQAQEHTHARFNRNDIKVHFKCLFTFYSSCLI